ncbi:MAG: response regulator [Candidatus Latescibacteria bacterium]|jgi:CheY-like chemotaxis protein|nr:response regulator [Candidatus Latescibacterota bacterium]
MSCSILIVDDEPGIRQALKKILQSAGHRTEEATTGLDALRAVRANRYDLVTMDMAMADMDGVDTVSVLRTEIDVPIVAISGHLTEKIRADLKNRQVTHFLEKPFGKQEVLDVVQQALAAR